MIPEWAQLIVMLILLEGITTRRDQSPWLADCIKKHFKDLKEDRE